MFGKRKNLRADLPPIDISHKQVKGFFGGMKTVPTTRNEQRKLKAKLMEQYPDRLFLDDLGEWNSVRPKNEPEWLSGLEELELLDEILDDKD